MVNYFIFTSFAVLVEHLHVIPAKAGIYTDNYFVWIPHRVRDDKCAKLVNCCNQRQQLRLEHIDKLFWVLKHKIRHRLYGNLAFLTD